MTSYPADLWGRLSPTTVRNLTILTQTVLEMYSSKAVDAAFLTVFKNNFTVWSEFHRHKNIIFTVISTLPLSKMVPIEMFTPDSCWTSIHTISLCCHNCAGRYKMYTYTEKYTYFPFAFAIESEIYTVKQAICK